MPTATYAMPETTMTTPELGSFCAGASVPHDGALTPLLSPMDLKPYAALRETPEHVIYAIVGHAASAYAAQRRATLAQRAQWLQAAAGAIEAHAGEIVALLVRDIGKPRRLAAFETQRSAQFLRACAAAALQLGGENLPLDAVPAGAGRLGFTRRIPYGVVAGITPFNAPINLVVQKVAPALAAGNAVVVKPHPAGTRVALRVAEAFAEAGVPAGLFSIVTGQNAAALALASHPKVMAVSFTGGTAAGHALARAAGAKKFIAELGSNSANVVLADADIADAAKRIAAAAFEASGQQCVSAQRIIVERGVYEAFLDAFVQAARSLKVGDPNDEATDVGPMVSLASANRVKSMLEDAIQRGGRYALAPTQKDCLLSPAIVCDTPRAASMWQDEAFGPVALVERAADIDEALRLANDSPFGLQGAVFTRSLKSAFRFSEEFDVGALWVNEASRFRLDVYPFGGVKGSGFGREGARYAIEELSQVKFTGIRFDT
jgi:acyl-CoA reductase-like NAD-dependent aldehyde dehydrogenase